MQRWSGLNDIPDDFGPCGVTIGVFDGVHRGHAALIARAGEAAHHRCVPCVVMTFDPHPLAVIAPDRAPLMLASIAHRLDLFAELGIDATLVLPFTREFADLTPEDLIGRVLLDRLHAELVVVGASFRFGRGGAGTAADMARLGTGRGLDVSVVALMGAGPARRGVGDPVSSSRIRTLLNGGDVEQVAALLRRPFRADGVVVKGQQRGRALGYPTANLDVAADAAVPADGIYAGRVCRLETDGTRTELGVGAISVGSNPTFDGQHRTVEAFILDFDADLYGDILGVEFAHRLRGMVRFDSIGALIVQMEADVVQARELMVG